MSPKYIKLIVAAGATLLGGGAIATTTNIKPAQEVATPIAIEETKPTITQETITNTARDFLYRRCQLTKRSNSRHHERSRWCQSRILHCHV